MFSKACKEVLSSFYIISEDNKPGPSSGVFRQGRNHTEKQLTTYWTPLSEENALTAYAQPSTRERVTLYAHTSLTERIKLAESPN